MKLEIENWKEIQGSRLKKKVKKRKQSSICASRGERRSTSEKLTEKSRCKLCNYVRSLFGERYSKWIYNLEKKAKIGLAKRTYEMKGSGAI